MSVNITGLQIGITYHFRIEATNANGTSYGADQTFFLIVDLTPSPPIQIIFVPAHPAPTATTSAATAISATGATVNGTVNPQNSGVSASCHFEYGSTPAYGLRVPASDPSAGAGNADHAVSESVTGLAPSTTYHFRVVATNVVGTSYGTDGTFTTQALPPVASVPGKVGTLGAKLKFTFACQGASGQSCQAQAAATAIEKLSPNGKRITGVLSSKSRSGRYRAVVVAKRNLRAGTGARIDVSIGLNSTGQMLRSRFKNVPANVRVTTTVSGRTTAITTTKVIFGPTRRR